MLAPFHFITTISRKGDDAMFRNAGKRTRQVLVFLIPGWISQGYLVTCEERNKLPIIALLAGREVVAYMEAGGRTICRRQEESIPQLVDRMLTSIDHTEVEETHSEAQAFCRALEGAVAF